MLRIGKPLEDMNLTELSQIRVWPFLWRSLLWASLIALGVYWVVAASGWLQLPGIVLLGLIYAHGVELQHQALHNTALPSKPWNRIFGFILGLPMLVSFSDYQYSHLKHHRDLGTHDDREFFNYGYERLTDLKPLLGHLMMVRHYLDVSGFIVRSLVGWKKPNLKEDAAKRVRNEYLIMAAVIAAAVGASIWFETLLLVKVWLLPLLIAIPAHALIELPEHWNQNQDSLNVEENTRTIKTGWLGRWFTNGNNYHIEHHWLPSVPNDKFAELHRWVDGRVPMDTYPEFYKKFFLELYTNTVRKAREDGDRAAT